MCNLLHSCCKAALVALNNKWLGLTQLWKSKVYFRKILHSNFNSVLYAIKLSLGYAVYYCTTLAKLGWTVFIQLTQAEQFFIAFGLVRLVGTFIIKWPGPGHLFFKANCAGYKGGSSLKKPRVPSSKYFICIPFFGDFYIILWLGSQYSQEF
jgi:hypothetical protein